MGHRVRTVNHAQAAIDKHQPQLTPTEWAYLAGIVDGEGTITILKVSKRKGQTHILQPKIDVTNTSERLLRWLGEKVDMRVNGRTKPLKSGEITFKRTPAVCYSIEIWGYRVYNVLMGIEPYLVIKREQARLVRTFLDSRRARSEATYNPPYTQEEIDLWLKVRALNRSASRSYPIEASLTSPSTT